MLMKLKSVILGTSGEERRRQRPNTDRDTTQSGGGKSSAQKTDPSMVHIVNAEPFFIKIQTKIVKKIELLCSVCQNRLTTETYADFIVASHFLVIIEKAMCI